MNNTLTSSCYRSFNSALRNYTSSLHNLDDDLPRVLPFSQILYRLPCLFERENLVDVRPDLVCLDETEKVFVQLLRADIDASA